MSHVISRRGFLSVSAGAGIGLVLGSGIAAADIDLSAQKLMIKIDCTQELPADQYFGQGDIKVVESAAGKYREAEGKPLSRFGYRFSTPNIGKPHVAVIRYPDDKRRYICVNDGTCYDLTTGVYTGWAQPVTNTMLELREIFWPRWADNSIVFMTWSEGEPAAVSSIEIYELTELAALKVPGDPLDGTRREIGVQYEDPCGIASSEGARTRAEWIDRIVQYMRYTGQGSLTYPMAWYEGPQFPSQHEPSDGFYTYVAQDRKQYAVWTTHPEDWYAGLLDRFAKEGLTFRGGLTLMRLGSLLGKMNIDLEAIKGGADTFNNMTWNNNVQAGTNDWTPFYNAVNLNIVSEQLKGKPPAPPSSMLPSLAYGEHSGPANQMGPIFNPLHPTVQEAIIRFAKEIGERYSRFASFRGITFNMFASCMPWFGSIRLGYDDYTIRLFEEETGIRVPVDPKAPDRFSQRYQHLTYVCRPAWVDWRCKKIRELFGAIHAALAAARSDLGVTVTLWDETTVPGTLGLPTPAHMIGARPSMYEFYRDGGIDIALYRDEPGLTIDRGMGNSRDRGGHGSSPYGGVTLPPEEVCMYRDFDFLDQEALDACHSLDQPGAFIFNCWVEAWGNHVWFQPEQGDVNVSEVSNYDGKPADGVLRMNSEYPKDGFWFDSQLRITPPFPGGSHFLEPYAQAIADFDACRILRGGLFMDKAHSEQLQAFAPAFRALPAKKFEQRGPTTDPVAVRTLVDDGKRYCYVVNREYYTLPVTLTFTAKPAALRDLATDTAMEPSLDLQLTMEPYGLRVFALDTGVDIAKVAVTVSKEILDPLTEQVDIALRAFAKLRGDEKSIAGMDEFEQRIRVAQAEGRVAWLRRALTSYIVRKAIQ